MEMDDVRTRKAALLLHGLDAVQRKAVLARLAPAHREALDPWLTELAELGIPPSLGRGAGRGTASGAPMDPAPEEGVPVRTSDTPAAGAPLVAQAPFGVGMRPGSGTSAAGSTTPTAGGPPSTSAVTASTPAYVEKEPWLQPLPRTARESGAPHGPGAPHRLNPPRESQTPDESDGLRESNASQESIGAYGSYLSHVSNASHEPNASHESTVSHESKGSHEWNAAHRPHSLHRSDVSHESPTRHGSGVSRAGDTPPETARRAGPSASGLPLPEEDPCIAPPPHPRHAARALRDCAAPTAAAVLRDADAAWRAALLGRLERPRRQAVARALEREEALPPCASDALRELLREAAGITASTATARAAVRRWIRWLPWMS